MPFYWRVPQSFNIIEMKNKLKNGGECGNTGNLRLRLTGGQLVVCLLRGKFTGTSRGEESPRQPWTWLSRETCIVVTGRATEKRG